MRHRVRLIIVLGILLALSSLIPATNILHAQGDPEACPSLAGDALTSLEDICTGLGRNEACYGHNRVDATFWVPTTEAIFSVPADRAALIDLQTIATAPLNLESEEWGVALLNVQADLPETLPGQAVTVLLMGDTRLQNRVEPEQAVGPVVPVEGFTTVNANIRSRPTTASNVMMSQPAGSAITLLGVNEARDWYEVQLPGTSTGWIFGQLVRVPDFAALEALPVTYGTDAGPRYGPMQAFYFSTGFGEPDCAETPNALVIQNTELAQVTLNINELEVQIGSTVIFATVPTNNGAGQAMVMELLEGSLETRVGGYPVRISNPGQTLALSLNEEGLVDGRSRLLRLHDPMTDGQLMHACQNAVDSGLFGQDVNPDLCDILPGYYVPPPPTPIPPTPTPIPGPIVNFVADRTTINPEECVTLQWDVENVNAVYFEGQGVAGHGSSVQCPLQTTTYTLNVVTIHGQELYYNIEITVAGAYINFYADRYNIMMGECVTIGWETSGVQEVYFEGAGVVGNSSSYECPVPVVTPPADVTYTLTVVLPDGSRDIRYVTIRVN